MITYQVKFERRLQLRRRRHIDFVGKGQVTLHDTCLVVSGPVHRFRIPLFGTILQKLLSTPSSRTVPYGAIIRYRTGSLLFAQSLTYNLPSEDKAEIVFVVTGGRLRSREFASHLSDNINTTKSLFAR